MKSLRQTYILRVWTVAPHGAPVEAPFGAPVDAPIHLTSDAPSDAPSDAATGAAESTALQRAGKEAGDVTANEPDECFYCSLQGVASEEIHYFSTLEETMRYLRNNALAFRLKPR